MSKKIIIISSLILIVIVIVIIYFCKMNYSNNSENIEKNNINAENMEKEETGYDFYIHEVDYTPGGLSNQSSHYYGYLSDNIIKQYKHISYVQESKTETKILDTIKISQEDKQKIKELLDSLDKNVSYESSNYYIIEYNNMTYEVPVYHEIIKLIEN